MSPELLTAYKLASEISQNEKLASSLRDKAEERLIEFLYILGKEYEIEKKTVERWAAQAAGIITK